MPAGAARKNLFCFVALALAARNWKRQNQTAEAPGMKHIRLLEFVDHFRQVDAALKASLAAAARRIYFRIQPDQPEVFFERALQLLRMLSRFFMLSFGKIGDRDAFMK